MEYKVISCDNHCNIPFSPLQTTISDDNVHVMDISHDDHDSEDEAFKQLLDRKIKKAVQEYLDYNGFKDVDEILKDKDGNKNKISDLSNHSHFDISQTHEDAYPESRTLTSSITSTSLTTATSDDNDCVITDELKFNTISSGQKEEEYEDAAKLDAQIKLIQEKISELDDLDCDLDMLDSPDSPFIQKEKLSKHLVKLMKKRGTFKMNKKDMFQARAKQLQFKFVQIKEIRVNLEKEVRRIVRKNSREIPTKDEIRNIVVQTVRDNSLEMIDLDNKCLQYYNKILFQVKKLHMDNINQILSNIVNQNQQSDEQPMIEPLMAHQNETCKKDSCESVSKRMDKLNHKNHGNLAVKNKLKNRKKMVKKNKHDEIRDYGANYDGVIPEETEQQICDKYESRISDKRESQDNQLNMKKLKVETSKNYSKAAYDSSIPSPNIHTDSLNDRLPKETFVSLENKNSTSNGKETGQTLCHEYSFDELD